MRIRGGFGHACKRAGVLIVVVLAIAACSRQPQQAREYGLGGEGPATPGSSRDFSSNVGDVVHFQVDSAKLTSEA